VSDYQLAYSTMETTRKCKACFAVRPLDDFPYVRRWRIHTCIDCTRVKRAAAQRRHYRNGGKEYIYQWYEARGGEGAYLKRKALERRLKRRLKK